MKDKRTGKIILTIHKQPPKSGVIRINDEAEQVLRSIGTQTGLSISYIASQIIIQGADLVEVREEE